MTTAILLLAGASTRFNAQQSKQLFHIKGKPVFSYSLETLSHNTLIDEVIVVVNQEIKDEVVSFINANKLKAKVVLGGISRQESVQKALQVTDAVKDDIILIHDGARPLIYDSIIKDVIKAAQEFDAATAYLPAVDTLANITNNEMMGNVIDRNEVVRIQTPQAFKASLIKKAHEEAFDLKATDDCSLVLKSTKQVKLVRGSECLHKITTIFDTHIVEGMIKND